MNLIKSLFYLLILCLAIVPICRAEGPASDQKSFQSGFYIGQSAGYAHGHGKRTEFVNYVAGANQSFHLSNRRTMNGDNTVFGGYGGYLHRFSKSRFFLAFEPGIQFGKTKERVFENHEAQVGISFPWTADLERKYKVEFPLKLGCVLRNDYFVFAILGAEIGRYAYEVFIPSTNSALVNRASFSKNLWGFTYGLGVGKYMAPFWVSVDLKNTAYGKFSRDFQNIQQDGASLANVSLNSRPQVFETVLRISYFM